jgi:hypothetical protein
MRKMLVSAAAALLLAIGSSNAGNASELKEGLWSVHTQSIDQPGNKKSEETYTMCRNHAYDQSVEALAKTVKGCTKVSESVQGGKSSTEMRCEIAGTVIDSKATGVVQGDTSLHSETRATYTPAFAGMSGMTIVMDQKYTGSCPAGAQPGDRTGTDGKVLHLGKH